MQREPSARKTEKMLFRFLRVLVILLVVVGTVTSQLADAAISTALYPITAAISGSVTNPTFVLSDNNQNASISTGNSSLTVNGFSMAPAAISLNSITFYWDIPGYTGLGGDDVLYFEYSLDNGTSWKAGRSYTTNQVSKWTFPHLESFTDNTNIPAAWTQADIAKVRVRIRTLKNQAVDGNINADVFYIQVDYNVPDNTPPNWPSTGSLSASGAGLTQVDLSWSNDATDNVGVTGWQIHRKLTSEGAWPAAPIYTATAVANSYADTTVSPGTSYDYRIRARDGMGNTSSWSNIAGAVTQPDTTGPVWNGFDSLGVTIISGHQVDLRWTNDALDDVSVTGWEIQRKLNSEATWPGTTLASVTGGASSYSDITVKDNTSYEYRIRAVDGSGNVSVWSKTAKAITPDMTPPVVTGEMPANGSPNVLRGSLIKVTFNKFMNTQTFSIGSTFIIHNNTNNTNITSGRLTFENGNQTAVFDPADVLPADAVFKVTVTTGVKDMAGNALAADYNWSFGTGVNVFLTPHGNFSSNNTACGICHTTHTGLGKNLIRLASVDQLCYLCHDAGGIGSIYTIEDDFNTSTRISTHKVPGSQQCNDCHNPHLEAVTTPKLLQTANSANGDEQLCWNCHGSSSTLVTDRGTDSAGGANNHQSYYPQDGTGHDSLSLEPASGTGVKCTKCHDGHGSSITKLLADPQGNIPATFTANNKSFCYECHTGAIVGADSAWDGKVINDNNRGHAQNCTNCHDPHGTRNDEYTIFSYAMNPVGSGRDNNNYPYNKADYTACWNGGCHQGADTALTQTTKNGDISPTGFWQEDLFRSNPTDVRVNLHNYHLKMDQYRPGRGNAVCKECHRPHGGVTNENPDLTHKVGFPSSTVSANSFSAPKYDNLDSGAGDPKDGGSCNLRCHNYTHTDVNYVNGGAISPGLPPGGQDCMDSCHNNNLAAAMGPSSNLYRHQVDSPQATYNEGSTSPPGQTTCLSMCHTDHNIFNSEMGLPSSPSLRSSGGSTPIPPTSGIPVEQGNTTCLSSACHGAVSSTGIDDPGYNSPNGILRTSDIRTQVNSVGSGFHPINLSVSNGPSNSYAKATLVAPWNTVEKLKCTDCHTQEAAPFGTHASSNRYMLKRLGPQSYDPVTRRNLNFQLYDALCVMCHNQTTYGLGQTVGTGVGSKCPNTHKLGKHYTGKYGCMECHAGNPEFAQIAGSTSFNSAAQRGSIHGWSYTYPGHTHPAEGFQNGLTISDYDPVDNTCSAQTGDPSCSMGAHAIQ